MHSHAPQHGSMLFTASLRHTRPGRPGQKWSPPGNWQVGNLGNDQLRQGLYKILKAGLIYDLTPAGSITSVTLWHLSSELKFQLLMKHFARYSCLLLLFALLSGIAAEAKQLAVVVDKSNSTPGLTLADLTKIFKFESRKWPDGKNVVLVLRDLSAPEMQMAVQKLSKLQLDEFKVLIAAHKSSVVIVGSEEDLLKTVATIPGAVGLVDVYSITSTINVIKVEGKLPLEQGYILKGN